jgi:hypothetical protein
MTVGAPHLALPDLCFDNSDRSPIPHEIAHVVDLVALVIELEHSFVSLATVDARVGAQVRTNKRPGPLIPPNR